MAEGREARAAVHLALDQLGFVVDAFGTAVVVRQGGGGVDCGAVLLEAPSEDMQVGQVLGLGRVIQVLRRVALPSAGSSSTTKWWMRSARAVISWQAVRAASTRSRWWSFRRSGRVSR